MLFIILRNCGTSCDANTAFTISSIINGAKPVIKAALNDTFETAIIQNVPIRSSDMADNIAITIKYILLYLFVQSMGTSAEITRNPILYPPYGPVIYPSPATPPTKTGTPAMPRSSHNRTIVNDWRIGNVRIIIVIIKVNAVICVPFGRGMLMYADIHKIAANIDIITMLLVERLLFVLLFSILCPVSPVYNPRHKNRDLTGFIYVHIIQKCLLFVNLKIIMVDKLGAKNYTLRVKPEKI